MTGVQFEGDEDFAAILSRIMAYQVRDLQQRFSEIYRAGFFIAAFAIFKGLSFPFTWLTVLVGWHLAYVFERVGGIVRVEEPAVRSTLRWN